MTEPSESNFNPLSLNDSEGFLDPSEKRPPLSTSPAMPRDAAVEQGNAFESEVNPAVHPVETLATATAVAEPPKAEPVLSKKEQKAKTKAEKRQAKVQAKADKVQAKADRIQAKQDAIAAKAAAKAADKAERKAAKAAAKQAKREKRQKSLVYRSSGFLFKLLGLGLAGSLAAIGGITVASFLAAPPSEEAPLLELGLERTSDGLSATQRLPKRLLQGLASRLDPAPKPQVQATAPALTESQRQQLIAEANALRQEIDQLNLRARAVEQQLGYDYSAADLEQRLGAIAQTLAEPRTGPLVTQPGLARLEPLTMTLPTDPLFADEQSALKPGSNALLATLLGEMRAYEEAIVTVSVHTDDVGAPESQRDLSLRRAQVVANYLRSQLGQGESRFIWNPIGAGSTQALVANDSNENRQRNRRIEISVTPQ